MDGKLYESWKERFYDYLAGEYINDKVDANANNGIPRPTMLKNFIIGKEFKEFSQRFLFELAGIPEKYEKLVEDKLIYIHDAAAGKLFKPYCFAFETENVRKYGVPISPEPKTPAKHPSVFVDHVAMLIHNLAQVFAGAVTPIDFLIQLAHFTLEEKTSDEKVKQLMQMFIHIINDDIREVDGSPFVNINIFDRPALKRLFNIQDEELLNEIDRLQRIFIEFFTERPNNGGSPYRFPVVTIQLSFADEGEPLDEEYVKIAASNAHLWYIYHNYGDTKAISTCCRLRNDLSYIRDIINTKKIGSLGTANAQIGSHRVISLNLPKILGNGGFKLLEMVLDDVHKLLKAHRELMREEIRAGILPYFRCKRYPTVEKGGWFDLDTMFFSTVGLIGLYEAAEQWSSNIDEILEWEKKIASFVREHTNKWSEEELIMYNVELVPAENAGWVLSDRELPLSTQYLPFWFDFDVVTRLHFAGEIDKYCNGGTVTFLPVGNKPRPEVVEKVIKLAGRKKVYYYTFNPTFTLCLDCGKAVTYKTDICPLCKSRNIDYVTRVTGWFTPVSAWHEGKKREFKVRQQDCLTNYDVNDKIEPENLKGGVEYAS